MESIPFSKNPSYSPAGVIRARIKYCLSIPITYPAANLQVLSISVYTEIRLFDSSSDQDLLQTQLIAPSILYNYGVAKFPGIVHHNTGKKDGIIRIPR